jgi:hypothetical protein
MTLFSIEARLTEFARGFRLGATVAGYGLWLTVTTYLIQLTWGKTQ